LGLGLGLGLGFFLSFSDELSAPPEYSIHISTDMGENVYKPAEDTFCVPADFDFAFPLPLPWGTGSSANVLYY
jgi:hypothetical protein